MNKLLVLIVLLQSFSFVAQVSIKGIAVNPGSKFQIGMKTDYISNEEVILEETISDSLGRFNFSVDLKNIEKLFIKNGNLIGYLYAQPKGKYYIEFSNSGFSKFGSENEVELVFIQLDTLDINYKILTFEHWLDQSLNILYPLKEKNSGEFLNEVKKFRSAVNDIYKAENNLFFLDYVKYTLGMNIEELQDFASPSEIDKFSFYLEDIPIKWRNDKFFGFVSNFYDKYFYQQSLEKRQEFMHLIEIGNVKPLLNILENDDLIGSAQLAEVMCIYMLSDLYFDRVIPRNTILNFLYNFSKLEIDSEITSVAQRLFNKLNVLDAGDKLPLYTLKNTDLTQLGGKPIYIQFFNPSNKKCIAELAAMKKLYKNYGAYIHFLTIYEEQSSFSKLENTYLDQITWDKTSAEANHPIWKDLNVSGFPYYVYVLPNQIIANINTLSPSPNGEYETIEKTLFEYKRLIAGEE